MHLFRDEQGAIIRAEIIDYKTDRSDDAKELHVKHVEQLHIYRILLSRALGITP